MNEVKDGIYYVNIVAIGVQPKDSGSVQAAIETTLISMIGKGDELIDAGGQRLTGWFTMINRDGSANVIGCEMIRDVLGWDCESLESLQAMTFEDRQFKAFVKNEAGQDGVVRPKLVRLYDKDANVGAGVKQADHATITNLDAKYGSQFRAMKSGGAVTKIETKPTPKPKQSDARNKARATYDKIVDDYNKDHPDQKYTKEERDAVWTKTVRELVHPKRAVDMTEVDWKTVDDQIDANFMPGTRGMSLI
jgi:hypothetical protein